MDDFQTHQNTLSGPAPSASPVTPSDTVPLDRAIRAIYVGGSGHLRVRMVAGDEVTFQNVQAGGVYPFRLSQVMATGTTATGLIGLR